MFVDFDRCWPVTIRASLKRQIAELGLLGAFSEGDIESILASPNPLEMLGAQLLKRNPDELPGMSLEQLFDALASIRRKRNRELEQAVFDMARQSVLVCCFSATGAAPTMWAHYAGNASGICIEYDLTRFAPEDLRLRLLLPVIYGQAPFDLTDVFEAGLLNGPESIRVAWSLLAPSFKDRQWSVEQEWRLVDPCGPGFDSREVPMPMKAVYLGPNISAEDAAGVAQAAQLHCLPVCKMQFGRNASTLVPDAEAAR
jgi:hypothetical protein